MTTNISPLAGTEAPASILVDVPWLITAYYTGIPDPSVAQQRVAFGTSGHRGSSLDLSFNEWHVLAITQAICQYRAEKNINGPLFLGVDTHALSQPACATALEVLAGNGVAVMLALGDANFSTPTPTPAISHAILANNRGRNAASSGLADGIVITPSHNPPESGGFKYNTPHGGPADQNVTAAIEHTANMLLDNKLQGVKRIGLAEALRAATTHRYDYIGAYIADLGSVIDMDVIRAASLHIGVDPLGGAGIHYWPRIAETYGLNLEVLNESIDPTFRFMTLDWDGRIRMDPSSPYAMQHLIKLKDRFDVAFACDTDHDRHGIVTPAAGLLPTNHALSVMIDYLFQHRAAWGHQCGIGKTVVSTRMIDVIAKKLNRPLFETPVGFKWFADGLYDGTLGFAGEESAGATFLRRDGSVWTTDKDGIVPSLLAAEITARTGSDLGAYYARLANQFGNPLADRVEAAATPAQKQKIAALSPRDIRAAALAGESITSVIVNAPGNGARIGGIKVSTKNGWFAARPSGTENIYKIYAESFSGDAHLQTILAEAEAIIEQAISSNTA